MRAMSWSPQQNRDLSSHSLIHESGEGYRRRVRPATSGTRALLPFSGCHLFTVALVGGHFPLYPRTQANEAAMIYFCRKLARSALRAAILIFFGAFLGAFAAAQERRSE